MSGIVLYGLMRGVRSSRRLEEALEMRLDFRWHVPTVGPLKSGFRQVSRDDAEPLREKLRQRMRTDQAKAAYDRRMQCERPFAAIKQVMGARQFLHRTLERVRNEWTWLVTAFNLQRMINIMGPRPGPN